jgi:hypothetical protein
MQIIWLGTWNNLTLRLPPGGLLGYLFLLLYLVAMLPALFAWRKDFSSIRGRGVVSLILLALATALFSNAFKLRFSALWLPPVPGTPADARPLEVPLLALLPPAWAPCLRR